MGPFVGPATSALLAAVLAGVALGLVRLSRVSLDWWRRRSARIADPLPALDPYGSAEAARAALAPFRIFPRVTTALACASSAALLVLLAALATEHAGGRAATPALTSLLIPDWSAAALSQAATARVLGALVALAATLVAAFVVAALDHGVERAQGRLWPVLFGRASAGGGDAPLSLRDLRAGVSGLWGPGVASGESFGAGLGYVTLFASAVLAISLVGSAVFGQPVPGGPLLLGVSFLLVPCAYAAAAERSAQDDMGLLRQRAALRQLIAAPAWALALFALVATPPGASTVAAHVPAWIALVLAVLAGMPGTSLREQFVQFHRGGDFPEPSAPVRAISGAAHHAWFAAWSVFMAVTWFAGQALWVVLLAALGVVAVLLVVRAGLALYAGGRRAAWCLAAALPLAVLDLLLHAPQGTP